MTVSAPYNFVPLSMHVCKAEDLGLNGSPSQDVPEIDHDKPEHARGKLKPDWESGTVELTLTSDTPLLVNWAPKRVTDVKTMGLVDDKPAIPGSTLRGMVRNVLEIASFGKMSLIDDARVTVRDLQPTARLDYGSRVADGNKRTGFYPLSRAGWLRMEKGVLRLEPCEFGRIDHDDLPGWGGGFHAKVVACSNAFKESKAVVTNDMTQAENVEGLFLEHCATLDHLLWVQTVGDRHEHMSPLIYRRVNRSPPGAAAGVPAAQKCGKLVFTGIPFRKNHMKHMEFFFYDRRPSDTLTVEPQVWRKFLDAHERQEKESDTWVWRREALYRGNEIPVFYLEKGGQVTALGLAMMFKLPADRSIGEMVGTTAQEHRDAGLIDLPERIFGRLETAKGKGDGWRGRVSFGWAVAEDGTWQEPIDQDNPVILAKPKPGFPAAYVRQKDFSGIDGTGLMQVGTRYDNRTRAQVPVRSQYRSYMAWTNASKSTVHEEVRGWKRYPVGPERGLDGPAVTGEASSTLRPIRPVGNAPITFTFRLSYHNLHPIELGAVIWALTWGGDDRLRHALGMGKPFGWGRTQMSATLTVEQRTALTRFVDTMEDWANRQRIPGGWAGSVQLRQLCAMADPEVGEHETNSGRLKQMKIIIRVSNDFVEVKANGEVLPEYGGIGIADVAGKMAATSIKTGEDLSPDAVASIMDTIHLIEASKINAAPVRYREGNFVSLMFGGTRRYGIVKGDTEPDGKTLVEYYRTRSDERAKRYSSEFFDVSSLEPLKVKVP